MGYQGEAYFQGVDTGFDGDVSDALRFIDEHYTGLRDVRTLKIGDLVPDGDRRSREAPYRREGESLVDRLKREHAELAEAILVLAGQLARRARQIEHMDRYPAEDPFADGATLEFEKRFPGSDKPYRYVAIKAGDRWHITGQRSPQNVTWKKLVGFMGLGVETVYKIGPRGGRRKVIG